MPAPHLVRLRVVGHGSRHDDSRVQAVLDALDERVPLVSRRLSEASADVLQASDGLVAQLHPGPSWDYFNLRCDQESQSATGPGHSVEQVRVLLLFGEKQKPTLSWERMRTPFTTSHVVTLQPRCLFVHIGIIAVYVCLNGLVKEQTQI